jgi:putative ABC transport system permease protein
MIRTLRQTARALAHRPGFSFFVILIMALAIGGVTSTFSAAKAILFQDLPYKEADRLVILNLVNRADGGDNQLSYLEIGDWRRRCTLLENLTPYIDWQDRVVVEGDTVERIQVNYSAPAYLKTLGAQPLLGRLFSPQEEGAPRSAPVVILGYELWARSFGQDPAIVGKKVQLNDTSYTVIGVLARDFLDFSPTHKPDAFLPAVQAPEAFPRRMATFLTGRDERDWDALARIKPGVSYEQAQREVETIATQMQREFPETNRDYGARLIPLRAQVFGNLLPGMKVLLAGSLFVLLIGCANVANLLLVRLAERQRDLSLRLALGASPRHLVRQVFAESLVLAIVGGVLGVLLGLWGTRLLAGLVELPPLVKIELGAGVLTVAVAATLLTGFLFALPPAVSVARMDARGMLQQVRAAAGGRTHSARSSGALLVFQIAVVTVLLVAAGLLLRSFWQLRSTGTGIRTDHLLTMRLRFTAPQYQDQARMAIAGRELVRRAADLPGVEGAALWGPGMPGINSYYSEVKREGAAATEPSIRADYQVLTPGAVRLLGIPLLRGREFTWADTSAAPKVSLVTQALADTLWPGQDPLGKRLHMSDRPDPLSTVVGVIRNTRFTGRLWPGQSDILFAQDQTGRPDINLLVRTRVDPASLAGVLRQLVKQVDSKVPVYDVLTMEERLLKQERGHRLNAAVTSVFSGLAVVLAAFGLYGVLAYAVVQRTREIGLRIALGAERQDILRMVMGRGLLLVGGGLLLGLAGALAVTRLLAGVLFGIKPMDPLTFAGVVAVFAVVAVVGSFFPARRAMSVEPTIALRFE